MKVLKEFAIPTVVLTLLCLIVSGALVLTYNTTQPIIEAAKIAESNKARAEVLTAGDKFEMMDSTFTDVVEIYKAGNGAGYVFTTKTKGYGGEFNVIVGVKSDGTIDKVKMMNANETPGLGTRVGEDSYLSKYSGKTGNTYEEVEAISGATVTSYAFRHGVKLALDAYAELAGVTYEEPKTPEQILFPDVETLEEITVEGTVKAMKAGDKGVLFVTEAQGYSEASTKMQVYTAISPDGKIIGVALGENTETQGIGSKTADEAYTSQYAGKENADDIEAITDATESSEGFQAAVKKAMEAYKTYAGGAPAADGEAAADAPAVDGEVPAAAAPVSEAVPADGASSVPAAS